MDQSERSALRNAIAAVLEHLIELLAAPAADPRHGWKETADRVRDDIDRPLIDSPGMLPLVGGMIVDEGSRAQNVSRIRSGFMANNFASISAA